ncbi:GNAT family N-acetyltransferase [Bacillus sp. FSL K6-3431]|uniref:GNAT family N-acetyltransferase n=1 Tax=Bacillus sp. FSL K6-3431 TaxID=2921500 RepID=UPI0030F9A2FE
MEKVEIRTIHSNEELEQVYELWANVFPENKAFFQERIELNSDYDFQTTWIAKVNGNIAASVQIFPYYTYYENTYLKVGGIGNVATYPEYRGRGLIQTILKKQTMWMRDNGFDLSLLFTDINSFYEKAGWHTVPIQSNVARNIPEIPAFDYSIGEFTYSNLIEVKSLYDGFSKKNIGPWIRSSIYWERQLNKRNEKPANFLIAKSDNKVVAYIRFQSMNGNIAIDECCYREEHENAGLSLLKEILTRNNDYQRVRITLAKNHVLTRHFQEWDTETVVETSGMWKVINFYGLLEKLRGVFTDRMQVENTSKSIDMDYTILLQCGDLDALLVRKEKIIDVKKPSESFTYNELIKLDNSAFISMILNGSEKKGPDQLQNLFPNVDYTFWGTDSF